MISDPVISAQSFHADALAARGEAGIATDRFSNIGERITAAFDGFDVQKTRGGYTLVGSCRGRSSA